MSSYAKLLKLIGYSDVLGKCAVGTIRCPISQSSSPPHWYGYPPALIPIWSHSASPSYYGLWKHWFVNRPASFVQMFVGAGRMTIEIARTEQQFYCHTAIMSIVEQDRVNDQVEVFSNSTGITNLAEIDTLTIESGDNPLSFRLLPQFQSEIPLNCIEADAYDGSFPRFGSGKVVGAYQCSEFELDQERLADVDQKSLPLWLKSGEPRNRLFEKFLLDGRLAEAWFTLNSRGWSIVDARHAVSRLSDATDDVRFHCLAAAWLSSADPSVGGY